LYFSLATAWLWWEGFDMPRKLRVEYTTSQSYNNRGLLQYVTNALGQITTNSYDARGRLTSRADNVGTTTYAYDAGNNLITNSENGQTLRSQYDAYNRLIAFTNAAGYVINYRYDANGNLTNLVYPGNLTVTYSYDNLNHLTNVVDWSGATASEIESLLEIRSGSSIVFSIARKWCSNQWRCASISSCNPGTGQPRFICTNSRRTLIWEKQKAPCNKNIPLVLS